MIEKKQKIIEKEIDLSQLMEGGLLTIDIKKSCLVKYPKSFSDYHEEGKMLNEAGLSV